MDRAWEVRLIPLPKELAITATVTASADEIGMVEVPDDVSLSSLLGGIARGPAQARIRLRAMLVPEAGTLLPTVSGQVAVRSVRLPDHPEAYALVGEAGERAGLIYLRLIARTRIGLLHAARTLRQFAGAAGAAFPEETVPSSSSGALTLPIGTIIDWPDIAYRGQWGGSSAGDIPWLAQWKFNLVEIHVNPSIGTDGRPVVSLPEAPLGAGKDHEVAIVPIILHLEQIVSRAGGLPGWEDCYGVLPPDRAQRSDAAPALCMKHPKTHELLFHWLAEAADPRVTDVIVWLSEEATPCYCDRCLGQEPFSLEVEAIVTAFRRVQAEIRPDLRLRILTTQGSHAVNDRILSMLPSDVGVTYYDGGRTYDASHAPIIDPRFEAHARDGRWVGVYAQLTNSWRTVLPWTAPHFIQARMSECVAKRLTCVVGYVVPTNWFHEFNVIAAAEWAWNSQGRTPREFAYAYAVVRGIRPAERFAEWADLIGPVGWDIAASRLFQNLIYDPSAGMDQGVPFDHRFAGRGESLSEEQIRRDLA